VPRLQVSQFTPDQPEKCIIAFFAGVVNLLFFDRCLSATAGGSCTLNGVFLQNKYHGSKARISAVHSFGGNIANQPGFTGKINP
jgi:hypothetical protein